MALAIVQTGAAATVGTPTSLTVTLGSSPINNNLLVDTFSTRSSSATNPANHTTAIEVVNVEDNDRARICFRVVSGDGNTVSFTGLSDGVAEGSAFTVYEVSGNDTSSPLDQTASTGRATGASSISSGTTPTLSQAEEICFVLFSIRATVTSPSLSNSYTLQTHQASSVSGSESTEISGYKIVNATTAQESTASWTGSVTAIAAIATFLGSGGGGGSSILRQMMNYHGG